MKAVIQLGYREYVMEAKDALAILEIIATGERYATKWRKEEDGGTSYHVWTDATTRDGNTLRLISDDQYRIAKLAGEPPRD
jgi:hypothetical protein